MEDGTLKNLEVGDRVVVGWTGYYTIQTVLGFTPTGLLKVDGNLYYPTTGLPRDKHTWESKIYPYSGEKAEKARKTKETLKHRNKCIEAFERKKYELTTSQYKRIIEIIEGPQETDI